MRLRERKQVNYDDDESDEDDPLPAKNSSTHAIAEASHRDPSKDETSSAYVEYDWGSDESEKGSGKLPPQDRGSRLMLDKGKDSGVDKVDRGHADADDIESDDDNELHDLRSNHHRLQGTFESRNILPFKRKSFGFGTVEPRATRAKVNYNEDSLSDESSKECDSEHGDNHNGAHPLGVASLLHDPASTASKGCKGDVSSVSSGFTVEDDFEMENNVVKDGSVKARRRRLIKLADRTKASSKPDITKHAQTAVKHQDKDAFTDGHDDRSVSPVQIGVIEIKNQGKQQESTSSDRISTSSGENKIYTTTDSIYNDEIEYLENVYVRRQRSSKGAPKRKPKQPSITVRKEEHLIPQFKVDVFGLYREVEDSRPIAKRVGLIEKILSVRNKGTDDAVYCVKLNAKGYRNVVYVRDSLLARDYPQLLRNFFRRMDDLGRVNGNLAEREDAPAFDPAYIKIDRIIASEQRGRKKYFFVKWQGLPYSESTWEAEDGIVGDDKDAVRRFLQISTKGAPGSNTMAFKDGRTLRDYQKKGVAWMEHNYRNQINCILADEMGLGKTIQSVSVLQVLRVKWKIKGPFLVIAPVSTLAHWQREIESLTDMNCLVYAGSTEDRNVMKEYEFHTSSKSADLKFNVLLTGFEILMKDHYILSKQDWEYIIVDEAHRLKTKQSKTSRTLKEMSVRKGGLLLLTGTPVQNNTKEIFSLLNILDPDKFKSEEEFLSKYGDLKNADQVRDLQENILKPRLLRRMKEDVEKSIPLKEETIIWVELTKDQRAYYRAIYENRISDLLRGSQNSNIPNLRNVAMELRKLCNHPFLCDGLEEHLVSKYGPSGLQSQVASCEALRQSSGKMLLLDKLLPMLKDAGRRVLIFSQFTMMLDLLEDYLQSKNYSYERIDGKIRGSERQAAIDRYSARGSETFVFLLSTRAGGLGITLTAADTCIIYDSDWNPQNDLQAMARCHRIGQTKDVKIYRLITRNTYEQHLFECSSRKYGLDEAILGNFLGSNMDIEQTKNIEALLKQGAYHILKEDGEAEAAAFYSENIDQILEQRTQQRLIGGRGNNTFSVATFISSPEAPSEEFEKAEDTLPNIDSTQFWQELLPEAYQASLIVLEKPQAVISTGPRRRAQVNYKERREASDDEGSSEEEEEFEGRRRHHANRREKEVNVEESSKQWTERELKRLENRLIMLGKGREEQLIVEAELEHRGLSEVQQVVDTLIQLFQFFEERERNANLAKGAVSTNREQEPTPKVDGAVSQLQDIKAVLENFNQCAQDSKWPVIPSFMQKALTSWYCLMRIQKNAGRYLQTLHERDVLSKALSDPNFTLAPVPRSKKLPHWWGDVEDVHFMRGALKHGHRDFFKIREDPSLCFLARVNTQTTTPPTDALQQSAEAQDFLLDGWPHDSVLNMRLKKIIESLPNGLSEREVKRRAAVAEAARKRWWLAKQAQETQGSPFPADQSQRGFIVYVDGVRYEQSESKTAMNNVGDDMTCLRGKSAQEDMPHDVQQQADQAQSGFIVHVDGVRYEQFESKVAMNKVDDDMTCLGGKSAQAQENMQHHMRRQSEVRPYTNDAGSVLQQCWEFASTDQAGMAVPGWQRTPYRVCHEGDEGDRPVYTLGIAGHGVL